MTPLLVDRHLADMHGPILTRGDLDRAEIEHDAECLTLSPAERRVLAVLDGMIADAKVRTHKRRRT